jgi:hypothetical protein
VFELVVLEFVAMVVVVMLVLKLGLLFLCSEECLGLLWKCSGM